MTYPRTAHGMVTMPDGRVMVTGGTVFNETTGYSVPALSQTTDIYDPEANAWALDSATMTVPRSGLALAACRDGSAIAIGGTNQGDTFGEGLKTAEQWLPGVGAGGRSGWRPLQATMFRGRWLASAVQLQNGSIAVVGGDIRENSVEILEALDLNVLTLD